MRVLAATVGAFLISVSHIALAQEHHGGMPKGEWRHGEAAGAERACEPLPASLETRPLQDECRTDEPGMQPAELRHDQLVQEEPQLPAPEQAEMHHGKSIQPETFQAEAERLLKSLPEAQLVQAEARDAEALLGSLPEARPVMSVQAQTTDPERLLGSLPEARPVTSAQAQTTEAERLLGSLPEARPVMSVQAQTTEAERLLKSLPEVRQDQPMEAEMQEERRQPEAMKAEVRLDQPAQTGMPVNPRWTPLKEQGLGTTMDLPSAVFSTADGHAHKSVGRKYRTSDGRAKVAVWTQRNTRRETPERYLRRTFNIPRATQDYERFTPDFAAVSGAFGGKVYYIRCNLSPQGAFHCFDLAYPVREKNAWDGIVTRMSRSLRPLYY